MNSSDRRRAIRASSFTFALLAGAEIVRVGPEAALWSTPAILLAAMMIAWAAEASQFYIAQGFALAILAWLQTLPEFAVEAVLAWKQQVPLLLAGLTGALRLLTGLGWPMIYFTAAFFHRRRYKKPLGEIRLADEHCVEVMGLLVPLIYVFFIWWKASLSLVDAAVLVAMYAAYLFFLTRMPPQEHEGIEDLDRIPRTVVKSSPFVRTTLIVLLFVGGGGLIYWAAEPFLGSLLAVSAMVGISEFVFIQWVAPFVSEFPEKVSAFYWARTIEKAPMALMNMVSSNINQWTLLPAMLVVVYSIARGEPSVIPFDHHQEMEILMTLGQSLVAMIFLVNMAMSAWEAAGLFSLWFLQFLFSPIQPGPTLWGQVAGHIHEWTTYAYLIWFGVEIVRILLGKRQPNAFRLFAQAWRTHLRRA